MALVLTPVTPATLTLAHPSSGSLTLVPMEIDLRQAPSTIVYPSQGFYPGVGLNLIPVVPS